MTPSRVRYNSGMSKDVSFSLDPGGGADILQRMAATTVKQRADAIAGRARSMASSMTSNPPEITVTQGVGIIRRGNRAIATIRAVADDDHAGYIGHMALAKARDAGRD